MRVNYVMSKLKSVVNILNCSHSDSIILNLFSSEFYNFSIFCIQFFNKFKYLIFTDLQLMLSKILIPINPQVPKDGEGFPYLILVPLALESNKRPRDH